MTIAPTEPSVSPACREETLAQAVTEFEEGRRQRASSDEAERQRVLAEVKRLELEVEESAAQLKQACGLVRVVASVAVRQACKWSECTPYSELVNAC